MHEENILKCAVQYCYYPSLARVIFKDVFTRNHNNHARAMLSHSTIYSLNNLSVQSARYGRKFDTLENGDGAQAFNQF